MNARALCIMTLLALGVSVGTGALAPAMAPGETSDHVDSGLAPSVANGSLTLIGAERVMGAARRAAEQRAGTGSIAVVDSGGHLLMLHRLDGTFAAAAHVSEGKARTAAIFKKPTRDFENAINNGRVAMAAMSDWTPLQGGVPIIVEGVWVGAVGVSGAASAQQDEEIAQAGAEGVAPAVGRQ